MSWLDSQVSLYSSHRDNTGRPATYREILLSAFSRDMQTIVAIRKLDKSAKDYNSKKAFLKSKLQCYTPSGLLESKAKGQVKELSRTDIMQIDFDFSGISDYRIEDLKKAIFKLSFIAFCGLSCSGSAFYALALIAEPERLREYAEQCFSVFRDYGVIPDTSKGRNVQDLRFVSYDQNMLIKENPIPLKITSFRTKLLPPRKMYIKPAGSPNFNNSDGLLKYGINKLLLVQVGQRWDTVQQVAYTLGGLNRPEFLENIIQAIEHNNAFAGEEKKYLGCAKHCFHEGAAKPLNK